MLGHKLKALRYSHGKMSQAALAGRLGITQQAVGLWEAEKTQPSNADLVKIANIFNVSTDYLLGNEQVKPKRPRRLQELIDEEMFILNGELATPEDKEKIAHMIEIMFYDAKEQNKRGAKKTRQAK